MKKFWKAAGLVAVSAALLVVAPVTAQAGGHWSVAKCGRVESKWERNNPNATSKQAIAYIRAQGKKHGCPTGG